MRRILVLAVIALAASVVGCAGLPPLEERTATTAFTDTAQTRLGRTVAHDVAANPGKTGIHPLPEGNEAFAGRVLLASAAEKSLDAQYYIWHGDEVGYLLFEACWQAAERGVRVRLLLDDLNTGGLDPTIAVLDAHPNIEVRLYNPVVQRGFRALNFVTDFTRVNRRMHNKSFTVDNQVSVVGSRNIGNEYFGAGSGVVFADLDVIAVGAAVPEISKGFDTYWNSPSAYPAARLVGTPGPDGAAELQAKFAETRADADSIAFREAVSTTPLVRDLFSRQFGLEWTLARVLYDDPAKTLDTTARTDVLLFPGVVRTMGRAEKSFDLVSPYFVPGDEGTAILVAQASKGVKIRILTNSLASSEASIVHSGYAKRREDLLRAGVQLYELKATAAQEARHEKARYGSSSSTGLHAKVFAVDRSRIFVGSFNFDQRSGRLNTEMGLVMDSPKFAQELAERFDAAAPLTAYEVRLGADGHSLEWVERTATGETVYDTEPGSSWFQRRSVDFYSILPIDWML